MAKKSFNPADWTRTDALHASPTSSTSDLEIIISRIEAAALDIAPGYADWRDLGFALADAFGENGRSYYHRLSRFYPNYKRSETDKQFSACLKSHGHGITIKTLYHLAKSAGVDISTFEISKSPILPKVVQGERRDKTRFDYAESQPTFDILPYCQNGNLAILAKSEEKVSESPNPQSGDMEDLGDLKEISCKRKQSLSGYETMSNASNFTGMANPQSGDIGDLGDMEDLEEKPLPTIPETVYQNLPDFLQQATAKATSDEDRDLLLLGSLVAISPCLPNIYGIYAERTVYPNLFLFVTAQASAGKGRLTLCRKIVEPIHRALREQAKMEQQEYRQELSEYASAKDKSERERPQEPPLRMLIIPANNSATGLFQILNDNQGIGLIFETEGDTLAQTFKSEHGNYSDGFRKAFHHEIISYNRRKDREFVELETPRLSALLSGTPKQVSTLIPNAENGLFSRFIFYYMNIKPVWKDVFAGDDSQTLDDYFRHLGAQFFDFYKILQQQPAPLRFCLTSPQQQTFNAYFSQAQNQYLYLCGVDYLATVRRLGLITFRIAMILTALRIMDFGLVAEVLEAADVDFYASLEIVKILIQHAAKVYETLPAETATPKQPNQKQQFLEKLPLEFSRRDYLAAAQSLNIPDKTAEKHIAKFVQSGLIIHFAHDKYKKM